MTGSLPAPPSGKPASDAGLSAAQIDRMGRAKGMYLSGSEISRLRRIETAAKALVEAHKVSHDTKPWPLKYGMNYGELVELIHALGI